MIDSYKRHIDYLRVSVTDRCNLRCMYCMPREGVAWLPHDTMPSFEEMFRLCRILAGEGIRKIKVTGGEPLVRKGVVDFIQRLKTIEGVERVTMTSNALLLDEYLDELSALDGINISLDTLDPAVFRRITGSDGLERIQAVLKRLESRLPGTGMPVKINCVPIQGLNEGDIVSLAELARNENIAVRFIELMPIGCAVALRPVPAADIIAMLEKAFGALKPYTGKLGNGPAVYYSIKGFAGKVGVIAALTKPFCEGCNRLRLTSTGLLKPCLSSDMVLDLKALLRGGATDAAIVEAVRGLVAEKPLGHSFGTGAEGHGEMFRVGG